MGGTKVPFEAQLKAILASAMDAVITVDGNLHVVLFNASAERIFGVPAAEALGAPLSQFLPERFRASHDRMVKEFGSADVETRRMGASREIFARRADGSEFPAEASISHVFVGGEHLFTVVLRDVSERVEAEKSIRRLNEELELRVTERTARLTETIHELERFTYTISHDLRAPLRAIDGYARMLAEDESANLSAEGRRMLGELGASAVRMGQLIDGLLRFSRLANVPVNRGRVDMNRLALDAAAAAAGEDGGRIRFDIARLPDAHGDPTLLGHVWSALVANAVKFSARHERPEVQIGFKESEGGPIYFVRDNGAGFDMAYADKLFGVFQRLHHASEFEGVGVGLAIARRIVEKHGGRMEAHGAPGDGATFSFHVAP